MELLHSAVEGHQLLASKADPGCAFAAILIFLSIFPEKIEILFFPIFWILGQFGIFWKNTKMRAPKFHAKPTDECPEISHMRPIQARKLKLKIDHFPDPLKKYIFLAIQSLAGIRIQLMEARLVRTNLWL